jgi:hypothetical protein
LLAVRVQDWRLLLNSFVLSQLGRLHNIFRSVAAKRSVI